MEVEFYIVFHHDSEFLAGAYVFFLSISTVAIFLILMLHFCYVCVSWRNPKILLYQKFRGYEAIGDESHEDADGEVIRAADKRIDSEL